jgi:hypothetical protein
MPAATVLVLLFTSLAPAPAARSDSRAVGCHSEWPVLTHHAGGRIVKLGGRRPIACATRTGFATSESTIGVTKRGTILYSPANTENTLARSRDGGRTWSLVQPQHMEYSTYWNTTDPHLTVDRKTGRIFWAHATGPFRTTSLLIDETGLPGPPSFLLAAAYGFQVYSSSDEGHHWVTADYRTAPMTDWEKVFVGPAPKGQPRPTGYPNVVYICANSPVEVFGPGRLCYRSLDGGKSFAPAGYVFPSTNTPDYCNALSTYTPVVGRDGTIYQPISCSNTSYVAVSRDEGASYEWLEAKGTPGISGFPGQYFFQLAVDDADDLYAVWRADDQVKLMRSRDHGRSWTTPVVISGPKLHQITVPVLAAGRRGSIAIAYYGSTDPSAESLTAYITETWNAYSREPLFFTAAINDPKRPIFHDYGLSDSPRTDFVGGTFDASGNFWAGMVEQLGAPDSNNHLETVGYVGRLILG